MDSIFTPRRIDARVKDIKEQFKVFKKGMKVYVISRSQIGIITKVDKRNPLVPVYTVDLNKYRVSGTTQLWRKHGVTYRKRLSRFGEQLLCSWEEISIALNVGQSITTGSSIQDNQ